MRKNPDGTWEDRRPVPAELLGWIASPEGSSFLDQTRLKAGLVSCTTDGRNVILRGADRSEVVNGCELIVLHLQHRFDLAVLRRRAAAIDSDIAAAEEELRSGLRCEFTVPAELLGLVIGKGGATVNRVKDATGVERIVIDDETSPPVVRIKGTDPEAVSEARRQLEYTSEAIPLSKQQVGWVVGSDGNTLQEMQAKSRVLRMQVEEGTTPAATTVLRIVGLRTAVNAAKLLVEAHLTYHAEYKKALKEEAELREKLAAMKVSYGESESYYRRRPAVTDSAAPDDRRGPGPAFTGGAAPPAAASFERERAGGRRRRADEDDEEEQAPAAAAPPVYRGGGGGRRTDRRGQQ